VDHRPADDFRPQGLDHASITLGLFQMTLIMRLVRAEMLEVLRTDYIRFRPAAA
jgi:ABC-type dipeptide/oligopeptide/nickel transport system permease component